MTSNSVSIVIPVFNEELAVGRVVAELVSRYPNYEILVIDDGSTDQTASVLSTASCRVVRHKVNRGYGASLKTGIRQAVGDLLVFYDGDGQFDPLDVGRIVERLESTQSDCVIGQRSKGSYCPVERKLGKFIFRQVASYLARQNLADPNCGLRIAKRAILLNYLPLFPEGFSASTTMTLLFLKRGYLVEYLDIVVRSRQGKSSVRQVRDGFRSVLLLIRLIALFDPLRIFVPPAVCLVVFSILYSIYEALSQGLGIPVFGAVAFLAGMMCFLLGVVCDQVAALRLERVNGYLSPTRE